MDNTDIVNGALRSVVNRLCALSDGTRSRRESGDDVPQVERGTR